MIPEHKQRVWVTLDRNLLENLDRAASDYRKHRSTLITIAVKRFMDQLEPPPPGTLFAGHDTAIGEYRKRHGLPPLPASPTLKEWTRKHLPECAKE